MTSTKVVRQQKNLHITQGNHANRLPNAEPNAWGNAPIQPLETIIRIDVLCSSCNRHLLRAIRILLLALHLNTDDLNWLIPSAEATAQGTSGDLLDHGELLMLTFPSRLPDARLSNTAEAEAGAPVRDLAHSDGIDTLIDAANALGAPDLHECLHCARRLLPRRGHLVLGDLDCLHAGTEAHGRVGLRQTADHTTRNTANEG